MYYSSVELPRAYSPKISSLCEPIFSKPMHQAFLSRAWSSLVQHPSRASPSLCEAAQASRVRTSLGSTSHGLRRANGSSLHRWSRMTAASYRGRHVEGWRRDGLGMVVGWRRLGSGTIAGGRRDSVGIVASGMETGWWWDGGVMTTGCWRDGGGIQLGSICNPTGIHLTSLSSDRGEIWKTVCSW